MRIYNLLITLSLCFAIYAFSLDKSYKSSFDYAIAYRHIKNLEKTKDIYRGHLITNYEKMRMEYIEQLFNNRSSINTLIQKMADENKITKQEHKKLIEMSFASLANLYVEFPSLNTRTIDQLLD